MKFKYQKKALNSLTDVIVALLKDKNVDFNLILELANIGQKIKND